MHRRPLRCAGRLGVTPRRCPRAQPHTAPNPPRRSRRSSTTTSSSSGLAPPGRRARSRRPSSASPSPSSRSRTCSAGADQHGHDPQQEPARGGAAPHRGGPAWQLQRGVAVEAEHHDPRPHRDFVERDPPRVGGHPRPVRAQRDRPALGHRPLRGAQPADDSGRRRLAAGHRRPLPGLVRHAAGETEGHPLRRPRDLHQRRAAEARSDCPSR